MSTTPPTPEKPKPVQEPAQAKISQKLIVRTAALLFVLAALFIGFRYFESVKNDLGGLASADTVGYIAAIQSEKDGQRAVVIKPDGKLETSENWKPGNTDRDLAWRPDGNFLFFCSDRDGETYHVFRWSPSKKTADARTIGKRGRSNPTFSAQGAPAQNQTMLIVSGGTVQELDPKEQATPQVLPPTNAEITTSGSAEEGGTDAAFSSIYGQLGSSFRYARWCKNKEYIAAVMRREQGEVLVLQSMVTDAKGKLPRPIPIFAAEHIEFDVNPADGTLVFSAQVMQLINPDKPDPQFMENGKIKLPFRHLVAIYDPTAEQGLKPIVLSVSDKNAFGFPTISPDGSTLLVTAGTFDPSGSLQTKALVTMPVKQNGGQAGAGLVPGEIFSPSWSPDGEFVAYAKRTPDGKQDIYVAKKDGSGERKVTSGDAKYSSPKFSPQLKPAG